MVSLYRLGFPEAFRPYPADRFNPAIDSRTDIVPGEKEAAPSTPAPSGVSAEAVFAELSKRVEADASLVQKVVDVHWSSSNCNPFSPYHSILQVSAVYQFVVTSGNGKKTWTVDLKTGPKGKVSAGASASADCTLTLAEKDFVDLVQGKLDPQNAFLKGLLKVTFLRCVCREVRLMMKGNDADFWKHGSGDEAESPLRRQQEGCSLSAVIKSCLLLSPLYERPDQWHAC